MSDDIAIRVKNLGKRYKLGQQSGGYKTLGETITRAVKSPFQRLQHPGSSEEKEEAGTFWALKDISFEVKKGEVIGIIGRNGAGKSTLLKILSRITSPTEGTVEVHGRIGSLLEVGTGFHPELTGRENIFLSGSIMGMKKAEIEEKFDQIVAFSEIEKFLDTPVKRYSSGMYVRLAFAVAAHLEPEILIVDEVLAVGDAVFQKKCLGKMGDVAKEGRTVLFVSHNMAAIRQLCPTSILLEKGDLKEMGSTPQVIDDYLDSTTVHEQRTIFEEDKDKEFQLREACIIDESGDETQSCICDKKVTISLICQVHKKIPGLYGYLEITKNDGTMVLCSDSFDTEPNPLDELSEGMHVLTVTIPPRTLGVGAYQVYLNFTSQFSNQSFDLDSPGNVCSFTLSDETTKRGNNRPGFFSTKLNWREEEYNNGIKSPDRRLSLSR